MIQSRPEFMKGAPWLSATVQDVSAHEKQKNDTEEESRASAGRGSDSAPGTGDNRGGHSTTWPLCRLASLDRAAGLQTGTLLRSSRLKGVTAAIGSGGVRE